MKPASKSGLDRERNKARGRGRPPGAREREEEVKEGLALLAIALLFLANVVLYVCHHYGLTSLNEFLHEALKNAA